MAVNHVNLSSGEELIDLRHDTITKDVLLKGYTAHGADGEPIVGEYEPESDVVDSGSCGENAFWELYENGLLVISGGGATYNYKSAGSPFSNRTDIKDVVIKEGITTIGESLFDSCYLENIVIPESVESIEMFAFCICENLKTIVLPSRCTTIKAYAFILCFNLSKIVIPDSVTFIGQNAFFESTDAEYVPLEVLYTGTKEQWDSIIIKADNDILLNATLHCQYDPNADTVDGWHIAVRDDGSDPPHGITNTLTFVYTVGG